MGGKGGFHRGEGERKMEEGNKQICKLGIGLFFFVVN